MKKSPKAHKKMLTWFFFFRPQHGQVDRDVDHNGSFAVMTSSTRGRINAWLPLYINATNWHYARRFEYTYLLTMTSLVGWLVGCLFRRGIPSNNNISSYTPFVFLSHETLNPFLSGGLFNVKFFCFLSRFAPSAFSIIATQVNDRFRPVHALQVTWAHSQQVITWKG